MLETLCKIDSAPDHCNLDTFANTLVWISAKILKVQPVFRPEARSRGSFVGT